MAAFGPAAFLMLLGRASRREAAPVPPVKLPDRTMEAKSETVPQKPASVAIASIDSEIDAFISRRLEFIQGSYIPASALYSAWEEDCKAHGIDPGSKKGFSLRIKKRAQHEPNNGRPRYCHVKLKAKGKPELRIVSG